MSIITNERLTKILSETQAVISGCNARGVHGSVEVNARLFENVLMELLRHRAATLQGKAGQPRNTPQNIPENIPAGWVLVPVEPTENMLNAWLSEVANWRGHVAGYKAMLEVAPRQEVKQCT